MSLFKFMPQRYYSTFDGEDEWAYVALAYDDVTLGELDPVHAVDDLPDLCGVQLLHKVIVLNRPVDQLRSTAARHINNAQRSYFISLYD